MNVFIGVAALIACTVSAVVVMSIWAHLVPPLEAEAQRNGLRVQVRRDVLRDLEISVNGGPFIALPELRRGTQLLPWSELCDGEQEIDPAAVRQVAVRGMSRFSRFETSMHFTTTASATTTSQTLQYVGNAGE